VPEVDDPDQRHPEEGALAVVDFALFRLHFASFQGCLTRNLAIIASVFIEFQAVFPEFFEIFHQKDYFSGTTNYNWPY
jgi:hypothetical protein